jgi:hypothetical protein
MEGWIVLLGAVLLLVFFAARYISLQLEDKDKNIKYVQNITPGSTQNSMPPPRPREKDEEEEEFKRAQNREHVLRRKQPSLLGGEDGEAAKSNKQSKGTRFFKTKGDFKRAILINEVFKRKT